MGIEAQGQVSTLLTKPSWSTNFNLHLPISSTPKPVKSRTSQPRRSLPLELDDHYHKPSFIRRFNPFRKQKQTQNPSQSQNASVARTCMWAPSYTIQRSLLSSGGGEATPLVLIHFVINVSENAWKGSSSEYCFVLDIKSISTCRGGTCVNQNLSASDKFRILSLLCLH